MSRKSIVVMLMITSFLLAGCNQKPEAETVMQTESIAETENSTACAEESTCAAEETVCTETTEPPVEETKPVAPVEVSEETRAIYNTVLEQYREAIIMDSKEYQELYWADSEIESSISMLKQFRDPSYLEIIKQGLQRPTIMTLYPYINRADLFWGAHYSLSGSEEDSDGNGLHYAYYDWSGDGTAELLVGYPSQFEGNNDSIIGIYTTINGEAVTVNNEIGQRAHVELFEGGILRMWGSNSASESVVEYYRLDIVYNYCTLNTVCKFTFDSEDPNLEYVNRAHEMYSEHMVPVTQFDWIKLFPKE